MFCNEQKQGCTGESHPAGNWGRTTQCFSCLQTFQATWYQTSSSEAQKSEQTYVWLCYYNVFSENFLFKTCLRAVRGCWLIRQHVDRQAGVFHSTASVVNSSRSVFEQWVGPGDHMLSKHVESECYGLRETEHIDSHACGSSSAHKNGLSLLFSFDLFALKAAEKCPANNVNHWSLNTLCGQIRQVNTSVATHGNFTQKLSLALQQEVCQKWQIHQKMSSFQIWSQAYRFYLPWGSFLSAQACRSERLIKAQNIPREYVRADWSCS